MCVHTCVCGRALCVCVRVCVCVCLYMYVCVFIHKRVTFLHSTQKSRLRPKYKDLTGGNGNKKLGGACLCVCMGRGEGVGVEGGGGRYCRNRDSNSQPLDLKCMS